MRIPQTWIKYYVLGFYVLILAVWEALHWAEIIPDFLFPSPLQVARRLWELTTDNYLWPSLRATFQRMGIGFSISAFRPCPLPPGYRYRC
jgi:sulfonate transport system permease protein